MKIPSYDCSRKASEVGTYPQPALVLYIYLSDKPSQSSMANFQYSKACQRLITYLVGGKFLRGGA